MNKKRIIAILAFSAALAIAGALAGCGRSDDAGGGGTMTLTNVSYDPTRELYKEYNELFQQHYRETTGKDIRIIQSHGGSGSQARSVIEGSKADVVTLALAHDVSLIERAGLIHEGWQGDFANDSAPYTSTIVFLVRKGNPKGIRDWDDLVKPGVSVITPDPKSSGGACWNFLAAWSWGLDHFGGNEIKTRAFMTDLYRNVTVMDSGARGSTTTFVENGQGDVLIAWETKRFIRCANIPISSTSSCPASVSWHSPAWLSSTAWPGARVMKRRLMNTWPTSIPMRPRNWPPRTVSGRLIRISSGAMPTASISRSS